MRTSKIMASLILASSFIPAFAYAVRDPSTISEAEAKAATEQAVNSMPVAADGSYDVSTIRFTKKDYMDQISKSFDVMDLNGDGVVDGQEMLAGKKAVVGNPYYEGAASNQTSSAPAGGVQPLNAKDLGQ